MSSDIGDLLAEQGSRLFERECRRDILSGAAEGIWPAELWRSVEAAGLCDVLVPAEAGGAGAGMPEALTIARLVGEFAAPVPLVETIAARWIFSTHGLRDLAGPATVAVTIHPVADSLTLNAVPWAREAQNILVFAPTGSGWEAIALTSDTGSITRCVNLAGEPRDAIVFEVDAIAAAARVSLDLEIMPVSPQALLALFRAAQMSGAMRRTLTIATGYANERTQFGRPIGRFQAVQQMLAEMAGHVAASGAVTDSAGVAFGPNAEFLIAAAKARSSEAAGRIAAIAHQVLGAIGYTQEHDLHWFTQRLWSWRDEAGNEAYWQEQIFQLIAYSGGSLWESLTAAPSSRTFTGDACR